MSVLTWWCSPSFVPSLCVKQAPSAFCIRDPGRKRKGHYFCGKYIIYITAITTLMMLWYIHTIYIYSISHFCSFYEDKSGLFCKLIAKAGSAGLWTPVILGWNVPFSDTEKTLSISTHSLNKHSLNNYYVLSTVLGAEEVSNNMLCFWGETTIHFWRCPLVRFCTYLVLKSARVLPL